MEDVYKMSEEHIRNLIFAELDCGERLRRKETIERVVSHLGFSQQDIRDKGVSSTVTRAKSRIGMVLSACIKSGYIIESESGFLSHVCSGEFKVTRERIRDYVISLLEKTPGMTKKQMFVKAEQDFGTDKTIDRKDDNDLHSAIGKVLSRLEAEGHIYKKGAAYWLCIDRSYPDTEMGSCLRAAAHGGDIKECFLEAVHIMGGEWFEAYAVELLESYYQTSGKIVSEAFVTGGSDDGGIDGIICTEDWLGYRERILMQMKNRRNVVAPKDVREFYGAVCAENGSRGVFITISRFHEQAWKLIDKVDNLTGIDGNKLFDIACRCRKGVIEKDGKTVLDEAMFLD